MTPMIGSLVLGHALAWVAASSTPSAEPDTQWWAGHQVTFGSRDVPLRGRVTTRTETLVLAKARVGEDRLVLEETACAIRFSPVGSVSVSMDATRVPMHRALYELREGEYRSRSTGGWSDEDIDDDGNPGMTIEVDAPLCSGEIYVAHTATTRAWASREGNGLRGRARVLIEQRVLGASNTCLELGAKDTQETVRGPFAYVRVPDGSTCASLIDSGWPIDAES